VIAGVDPDGRPRVFTTSPSGVFQASGSAMKVARTGVVLTEWTLFRQGQEWRGVCVGENAKIVNEVLEGHLQELPSLSGGGVAKLAARALMEVKAPESELEVVLVTRREGRARVRREVLQSADDLPRLLKASQSAED
jgi:20S proteasome alpha/beta subunit